MYYACLTKVLGVIGHVKSKNWKFWGSENPQSCWTSSLFKNKGDKGHHLEARDHWTIFLWRWLEWQCDKRALHSNEQPWWTPLHKPHHIIAQFDLAKTFLDKENCFWEHKGKNLDLHQWFTFQQDKDPKHTFKSVRAWFQKKKITVLLMPSISPDLNPIKNLWQELKVWINHQSPKNL